MIFAIEFFSDRNIGSWKNQLIVIQEKENKWISKMMGKNFHASAGGYFLQ